MSLAVSGFGSGTFAAQGSTSVVFQLNGVDVQTVPADMTASGSTRTVVLTVPSGLSGPAPIVYTLRVLSRDSSNRLFTSNGANFTVLPSAGLASVSPNGLPQSTTADVVITGFGTSFASFSTVAFLRNGSPDPEIQVNSVTRLSATQLRANITISGSAPIGTRDVQVTTNQQVLVLTNGFAVQAGSFVVTLTSIAPPSGGAGQVVQVQATGFQGTIPANLVRAEFRSGGTTVASVTASGITGAGSDRTVSFVVPAGLNATGVPIQYQVGLVGFNQEGSSFTSSNTLPFSVNPAPSIVSVTPSSSPRATTLDVTIRGSYVDWSGPVTVQFSQPGITVNSVTVLAPTGSTRDLVANITIAADAPAAVHDVIVTSGTETVSAPAAFTVTIPQPAITSVTPSTGTQGSSVQVTITGTNLTGANSVSFGSDIAVTITSVTANSIAATLNIGQSAALGMRTLTVGFPGGGTATLASAFEVRAGSFTVTLLSVTPSAGGPGQVVQIQATGFQGTIPANLVTVQFSPGGVAAAAVGTIVATVPATAISGTGSTRTVSFVVPSGLNTTGAPVTYQLALAGSNQEGSTFTSSNTLPFTVNPPASILSVTPNSSARGTTLDVTIRGSFVDWNVPLTVQFSQAGITVNSTALQPASGNTRDLIANITIAADAAAAVHDVSVTSGGVTVTAAGAFTVTIPQPTITSVTPASGARGTTVQVTIAGTNLTGADSVSFGSGIAVTLGTVTATSIAATLNIAPNAATGMRTVTVGFPGGGSASLANAFEVRLGPAILSVNPSAGLIGSRLSVDLTVRDIANGSVTSVSFGAGITVNSFSFVSADMIRTDISINAAAAPGARDVTVVAAGSSVIAAGAFNVLASAAISSVSPTEGARGSRLNVDITVAGIASGSVTSVGFGSGITVNSFSFTSANVIRADISIDAAATLGTRDVTVVTNGTNVVGTAAFRVIDAASISLNPTSGAQGAQLQVVITGTGTSFSQGTISINFGSGITVQSLTVSSATSASAQILIDSDATLGARTVTVTAGGQSLTSSFTVVQRISTQNAGPLLCRANTGVPPLLRAEGFTELTGDIVLTCTGGTAGQSITINLQMFLNTNITSRIVNGSATEALLIIDESTASGNIFRGQRAVGAENSLIWPGINFIAPGTGERILRITNVRVNASSLGVSANLVPTQVVAFLSISPSGSLALNNPQQTVGYVQPGLAFDARGCNGAEAAGALTFFRCEGLNSSGNRNLSNAGGVGNMTFSVRFREGFPSAFRPQIAANQIGAPIGQSFNSESGFVRGTSDLPFSVGGATSGTRLMVRFNNVPQGVRLFVTTVQSYGSTAGAQAVLVPSADTAVLQPQVPLALASTNSLACSSVGLDPVPAVEVPIVNGTGTATWEVTASNFAALDDLTFGVGVAYSPNLASNVPALGQANLQGLFAPNYAPGSSAERASSSLPIPRFVDSAPRVNAFRLAECTTTLLFPYVTNRLGFDTGIAISNTSRDPFEGAESRMQGGNCTLNFYGRTGAGVAPVAQRTTGPVASGETLTYILSSGGTNGLTGAPDFQGYIIAQCDFLYAHGFAFITDGPIGSARVAEGYLAIVLNDPTWTGVGGRAGATGENTGH